MRGMIVMAASPDGVGSPRPFLVVQSDAFNDTHGSVTVCPMTGVVGGQTLFRVAFAPAPDTGLSADAEVQVDKIQSLRRARIARAIGSAPATAMEQVDQALRRWLAL